VARGRCGKDKAAMWNGMGMGTDKGGRHTCWAAWARAVETKCKLGREAAAAAAGDLQSG
jgi:hypothetical protein